MAIFTNREYRVETIETPFATLKGLRLGEEGRGRSEKIISIGAEMPEDFKGLNGYSQDISVRKTLNGNWELIPWDTGDLYMIINTNSGYKRGCSGEILELVDPDNPTKTSRVERLQVAWGAYGDAGGIGGYDELLLRVYPDAIIKINYTTGSRYNSNEILFVEDGQVVVVPVRLLSIYYDSIGRAVPDFEVFKKEEG